MIIFNTKEMKPTYIQNSMDNRILDIRSSYHIDELIEKLRAGEEIPEDKLQIRVYETEPDSPRLGREFPSANFGYDSIFSLDDYEEYSDHAIMLENVRPKLYEGYEAFLFNNTWGDMPFRPGRISNEELLDELYDAIGIMPTVKNIPDKSVQELLSMSSIGERLYWTWAKYDENKNHYPDVADIEFYQSLNSYEQRLINESKVHPLKVLDTLKKIKEITPKAVLTKEVVMNLEKGYSVENAAYKEVIPFFPYNYDAIEDNSNAKKINEWIAFVQTDYAISNLQSEVSTFLESFLTLSNNVEYHDIEGYEEFTQHFPDKDTADLFITSLAREMVLPDNDNDFLRSLHGGFALEAGRDLNIFLKKYMDFAVTEWVKFSAKHKTPESITKDTIRDFAKKEYKAPMPSKLKEIEEAFKTEFHGHAPRILAEYVEAYCMISGKNLNNLNTDDINQIVKGFNQKNVQKIAASKNEVLLALSPYINFAEIKQDYIDVLASEIYRRDLGKLKDRGFIEWFKAHKDTKISELSELISHATDSHRRGDEDYVGEIEHFDINKSAKELTDGVILKKAYEDIEKYENKYHYKFSDNELAIKGRHIVASEGNMKMYMLAADDPRNFTIGYDTNCCQHFGNAGESCVWKYTTDPYAGAVVIERNGKILAQAFVWTDEQKDTFVFDNMEFANDAKISTYSGIIAGYVKALPYKNVHIGTGYLAGGMKAWGKSITYEAQIPVTIYKENPAAGYWGHHPSGIYTDYHFNEGGNKARALKTDGKLLIREKGYVKVESRPDEPTRWDILSHPAVNFLLNDSSTSIRDRIDFANRFLHDQTPEVQMEAVRKNPAAIKYIEEPTVEVQEYVVNADPKNASYINNPCDRVQEILLHNDAHYIRNIVNPTEDMAKYAVTQDGLLLENIKNPSDAVIDAAIKQNGYAIRLIPAEKQTEARQVEAVAQNPKVISFIEEPADSVAKAAIDKDPHIIAIMPTVYNHIQLYAVNKDPAVINDIKNPTLPAIEAAVKKNGLLIRNFQHRAPQLRMEALKQNGFAIRSLKDPTLEEMVQAVKTTPAAINAIKGREVKQQVKDIIAHERDTLLEKDEDDLEIG